MEWLMRRVAETKEERFLMWKRIGREGNIVEYRRMKRLK